MSDIEVCNKEYSRNKQKLAHQNEDALENILRRSIRRRLPRSTKRTRRYGCQACPSCLGQTSRGPNSRNLQKRTIVKKQWVI